MNQATQPNPDASDIRKPRSAWLAGLLSLVCVGLGQLYNGQPVKGAIAFGLALGVALAAAMADAPATFNGMLLALAGGAVIQIGAVVDAVISARARAVYELQPYNQWFVYLGVGLVLSLSLAGLKSELFAYDAFHLPTGSMKPALHQDDHIVVSTDWYADHMVQRGEVVVFRDPVDRRRKMIKRVIGLPGEVVEIVDDKLMVNHKRVDDPWGYFDPKGPPGVPRDFGPIRVPEGAYFVLGDNRRASADSRFWPEKKRFVPQADILGKALYVYWSTNTDRLGTEVHLNKADQ